MEEIGTMAIELGTLANEIKAILGADPGREGRLAVRDLVKKALADEAFIEEHLRERAPGQGPREVLYEDPDLGFCICGHVYDGPAHGQPHDHGTSWAVYGQATGTTEMTDWRIVEEGSGSDPKLVEPVRTYTLEPGDAYFYDVGDVHSPSRSGPTSLIRIEGANLDHVKRSNIAAKAA